MYLPESVDYFLTREEVCSKMNSAGFSNIVFKDMTFGVATIYTGVKDE
jgi:demethylmenaquinone methyltransferase/2-methoxy-6-polyprenyl-1,4-benzoquinol methylase